MTDLKNLIGKSINNIYMDDNNLIFDTNDGLIGYQVEGDCCSSSYFHDFIGVDKLLKNKVVKSVKEIDLEVKGSNHNDDDEVQAYGFELVTEDSDFGEVTSVMSFRNSSNGYYGGYLVNNRSPDITNVPKITHDWVAESWPNYQALIFMPIKPIMPEKSYEHNLSDRLIINQINQMYFHPSHPNHINPLL